MYAIHLQSISVRTSIISSAQQTHVASGWGTAQGSVYIPINYTALHLDICSHPEVGWAGGMGIHSGVREETLTTPSGESSERCAPGAGPQRRACPTPAPAAGDSPSHHFLPAPQDAAI